MGQGAGRLAGSERLRQEQDGRWINPGGGIFLTGSTRGFAACRLLLPLPPAPHAPAPATQAPTHYAPARLLPAACLPPCLPASCLPALPHLRARRCLNSPTCFAVYPPTTTLTLKILYATLLTSIVLTVLMVAGQDEYWSKRKAMLSVLRVGAAWSPVFRAHLLLACPGVMPAAAGTWGVR